MIGRFLMGNRFQSSHPHTSVREPDRIIRLHLGEICVYRILLKDVDYPQSVILFSKDPKIPISELETTLEHLSTEFRANVYTYEYNIDRDDVLEDHYNAVTEAVYNFIRNEHVSFSNMIFMGQSLGCSPVLHLTSKPNFLCPYKVRIILIFPIQSLAHLAFGRDAYEWLYYFFQDWLGLNNMSMVEQSNFDLVIIHGDSDTFLHLDHALGLYRKRFMSTFIKTKTSICAIRGGTQENILDLDSTWTLLENYSANDLQFSQIADTSQYTLREHCPKVINFEEDAGIV